jgi:hypothetical protein
MQVVPLREDTVLREVDVGYCHENVALVMPVCLFFVVVWVEASSR